MRKRQIDSELWAASDLAEVSFAARLLYLACAALADEKGLLRADAEALKSLVFPHDDLNPADVQALLAELVAIDRLRPYRTRSGEDALWVLDQRQVRGASKPSLADNPAVKALVDRFREHGVHAPSLAWLHRAVAECPRYATPTEVNACVAHAQSTGRRRLDWGAAFYRWCLNEAKWARESGRQADQEHERQLKQERERRYFTAADLTAEEPQQALPDVHSIAARAIAELREKKARDERR